MNDANSKLLDVLLHEIDRLEATGPSQIADEGSRLMGRFVDAALHSARIGRSDLAEQIDMDPELLDAILDGLLPADEISDPVLIDIAGALHYEANLLRLMLGRPITPAHDATQTQG